MNMGRLIKLEFWGVNVDVKVDTVEDYDHLIFYFGSHTRTLGCPRITVLLSTEPTGLGFVSSVGNTSVLKIVEIDDGDGPAEYETFTQRARRPTPLPPFFMLRSTHEIRTLHAACVSTPSGSGAVLVKGASAVGKSTILLALLERGWGFMADDIAVLRENRASLYHRPIGVRSTTAELFPQLSSVLSRSLSFETATGWTHMMSPIEAGYKIGPSVSPVIGSVTLLRATRFKASLHGSDEVHVEFDPQRHLHEAVEELMRVFGGERER